VVLDKGRIIFDGDVEEAIGIYMGADGQTDRTYDYSKINHRPKAKETIMLSFCEIMNEDCATYLPGTKLNLKLGLLANRIGKNLRLRMEVSYRDGTMAATAFTGDITDKLVLGENVLNVIFDTAGLVPGEYSVEMCAYEITSEGQEFVLDDVTPAFCFVLDDETNEDKPVWLHQWWGHVRLNDVQFEESN
jgi:lipopolysaccharide transport system ATP-binding protein